MKYWKETWDFIYISPFTVLVSSCLQKATERFGFCACAHNQLQHIIVDDTSTAPAGCGDAGCGGPGLVWVHMMWGRLDVLTISLKRLWRRLMVEKWTFNSMATALVDIPAVSEWMCLGCSGKASINFAQPLNEEELFWYNLNCKKHYIDKGELTWIDFDRKKNAGNFRFRQALSTINNVLRSRLTPNYVNALSVLSTRHILHIIYCFKNVMHV